MALGDVLPPVDSTHGLRPAVAEVDHLRATIVTDKSHHGKWLRLAQYGPLPKRIALGVASSWRRAKPDLFGGDWHFQSRIMPIGRDDSGRQIMTVRTETLYVVEVSYPRGANENG